MANTVYTYFKHRVGNGEIDLGVDAMVAIPCGTSTTVLTDDPTAAGLSQFTTLDELTTGGFGRVTLTSPTDEADDTNNRGEWKWAAIVFSSVTGTLDSVLICKDTGADATFVPIWAIDAGDTVSSGGDITVNVPAEGFLQSG